MNDIQITSFKPHHFPGERSIVVAEFNAVVNGFNIRRGHVRTSNETGRVFVSLPGRSGSPQSITIPEGDLRSELEDEVLGLYERGAVK